MAEQQPLPQQNKDREDEQKMTDEDEKGQKRITRATITKGKSDSNNVNDQFLQVDISNNNALIRGGLRSNVQEQTKLLRPQIKQIKAVHVVDEDIEFIKPISVEGDGIKVLLDDRDEAEFCTSL